MDESSKAKFWLKFHEPEMSESVTDVEHNKITFTNGENVQARDLEAFIANWSDNE